ncbi:MAG: ATP-grasp domain-containing protein, partial [Alphaproteobacteria bacterium]|nr:ATP-grasp domain-containing protein [Alphaproteobacteria bacterium]
MAGSIDTVLIANRGEIACRVIATCRRMGIATVAVHSAADRDARHVRLADRAVAIGPAAARDSYLRGDRILEAARATGADAIHPGYGFLSENPDFAAACAAAGIVFVGPPAAAIRAMGLKAAAKERMAAAGVPVLAGYNDPAQDEASLVAAAARIGYPVLVKPSASGGGKGMHIAETEAALRAVLARARREAKSAFGDDALILERFLARPRHVEVQVFADTHGNAVHLFERDCSLQRRYQKVIEEAPAPALDPSLRETIGRAAVTAARAIGYVGAGTVEFLLDGAAFWFMEMNTRLQVEHPATEMITGLDLVEWQLRIARGENLPCDQASLRFAGHAIEARLYAEDPARDFAPSSGLLARLRFPKAGADLRIDTGVEEGDTIPVHYDPLIAKIIAHGPDRDAALARLRRALDRVSLAGPDTNLGFLRAILDDAAVRAGPTDTRFLDRAHARLAAVPPPPV